MHLLLAQKGMIDKGEEALDLGQSPADLVIITSTDTELQGLARAKARLGDRVAPLRLVNIASLKHNYSVDLYAESVLEKAKLVVLRILGGEAYWPYGLEECERVARAEKVMLAAMPGCGNPDRPLMERSTVPLEQVEKVWHLLVEGGSANYENGLLLLDALLKGQTHNVEVEKLDKIGGWDWQRRSSNSVDALLSAPPPSARTVPILFYRALLTADDLAPIQSLSSALAARGLTPLPIFVTSLKDGDCQRELLRFFLHTSPVAIVNLTAFAVGQIQNGKAVGNVLDQAKVPVIQAVLAGRSRQAWRDDPRGMGPRELAMHVALPEIDGRLSGGVISFKSEALWDQEVEASLIAHQPDETLVERLADKVHAWSHLGSKARSQRKVAIILSRYPGHDGGVAHGVGLDSTASLAVILERLAREGYSLPEGDFAAEALFTLMEKLDQGATGEFLSREEYSALAKTLPEAVLAATVAQWGEVEDDAFFCPERQGLTLPVFCHGNIFLCLQPPRAREESSEIYHDLALAPPHGYLAFYLALRLTFGAEAVLHLGKHGTLEWLPGKALALSEDCTPEALLGPLPNLYPFIVNDPGEGCQAKRRSGALIIDHLTPPLLQSDTYDALAELERLVDEYFEAANADPRRLPALTEDILSLARASGLEQDCGIGIKDEVETALQKLDAFLCDLKALQIRGGLHILGQGPQGDARVNLLAAFARSPRGKGEGKQASLLRALAEDLGLKNFDPLAPVSTEAWSGPRPAVLRDVLDGSWRSVADTRERVEALASALISKERQAANEWSKTRAVLDSIEKEIAPLLDHCGKHEIQAIIDGLDGKFVAPGPAGAPTRGRTDVLPTGRNFFAVDTRAVPTPAAFRLGYEAAERLITLYRQDHGDWPRRIAMTAWGTANMRTGGDDIAIALSLIGVRPSWDSGSFRLTGFEIISLEALGRPRVDILLRLSGFFRDAFPEQIALLNSAVDAVARLAEPPEANPLKVTEQEPLEPRLFSNQAGAFGGGIKGQTLSSQWETRHELADRFMEAGGFALGKDASTLAAHDAFRDLLAGVDIVTLTQDSREFDLLDSDDFFDFEGGLAAAAESQGAKPALYHGDSSKGTEPTYRTLSEELALIVRGRAAHPKWIAGMKNHGGRGAFEMARALHALYGFAATTDATRSSHFEALFEAYILNEDTRSFIELTNKSAYDGMIARFAEAESRGFWQPKRNSVANYLNLPQV